jgi:uncharacterized protein YukE
MSLLPDPDQLDRLAAEIDGHADHLRQQAGAFAVAADQVQWHSTAAAAFRARAAGVSAELRAASAAVGDAAASLRRHAQAVRNHASLVNRLAEAACPPLAMIEAYL